MKHAHAKAPGKLYVAGEYAVVEPGHPAVIVAVDRFISVSVSPSADDHGTLYSSQLSHDTLNWFRTDSQISLEKNNDKARVLLRSMEMTERYLKENGMSLPYYDLTVTSSLDSEDGRKYGLGSSGAVTVAAIRAILASADVLLADEHLYKLAAVTHMLLHSRGSFGDIASATYTGWIAYASPDRTWLEKQLNSRTLTALLDDRWPGLKIERLPAPTELSLTVGWTGVPASTESYVTSVQEGHSALSYREFLRQSTACVQDLIAGLKSDNKQNIAEPIRRNRQLLLAMSQSRNITLETPLLQKLSLIAESHGAAAKTSGAGGGDCGIALTESTEQRKRIALEWRDNKIEPLALNVYDKSNS